MENAARSTERDPVCGMMVNPASNRLVSSHKGRTYRFCAESCLEAFEKHPDRYLKEKGVFRRWLDRMAKSNQESFGSKGPSCCH
jgi:YHS domain-containing protein